MIILTDENPLLRKTARAVNKVDADTLVILDRLATTARMQKDPEGVGLAAPQVGVRTRVFVAFLGGHWVPFINPTITWRNDIEDVALEGCLSFPSLYGEVRRPTKIELTLLTKKGRQVRRHYAKLAARIIQHETDHLDGVLFIDHVSKQGGKLFRSIGKDEKGKDILQEVKLPVSSTLQ